MAIMKPEEMTFENKNIVMIITGLPGVGKTTLALSAPDVLLIDADEGLCRVQPAHRKDSSVCKTYEELLEDMKAAEGKYKTIVIDTCGALIEMMKDWTMRTDPKSRKASGGISQTGFGVVKSEFVRLSSELRKKFNVIFLFHSSKERNGDEVFYDIVCEGSARTLVWQPADLGAHLHIVNGERYLGFTPTMHYNAKSAYGIRGLIKVPELREGDANDFLAKIFANVRKNLAAENTALNAEKAVYEEAMALGRALVDALEKPEQVPDFLKEIATFEHALTSKKEIEALLKRKMKELGITYDKAKKEYVYAA